MALAVLARDGECKAAAVADEIGVGPEAAYKILRRIEGDKRCKSRLCWIKTTRKIVRLFSLPGFKVSGKGVLSSEKAFKPPFVVQEP